MKVEVKSGTRRVKTADRFGVLGDRITPVVEVWIDGVCCIHECRSHEEARALVIRFAYALGIE
jgi:hypothetical protein